jgi:superfamily I DNA/RNA helicase
MEWSPFQIGIYHEIDESVENLVIQAVAGSGKSTVLFEAARREVQNGRTVIFLAFNKDIAEYATGKIGRIRGITCSTFHSYGLRAIKEFTGFNDLKIEINHDRVRNLIFKEFPRKRFKWGEFYPGFFVLKVVRKIRQLGLLSYESDDILEFIAVNDLYGYKASTAADEKKWVKNNIRRVITIIKKLDEIPSVIGKAMEIDFDDMVRLPSIHQMVRLRGTPPANTGLIDEGQDMNPYQFSLITQLYSLGVRIITVGDRNQAIYAFRGAYSDSLDRIKDITFAKELPLSLTYRTRQNIVDFVNEEIGGSRMEAFKEGGNIKYIEKEEIPTYVKEYDIRMIVGARNKSLTKVWIQLAKEKIGSTLKGAGIVEGIRKLLEQNKADKYPSLQHFVDAMTKEALDSYSVDEDTGEQISSMSDRKIDLIECMKTLINAFQLQSFEEFDAILEEMEMDSNRNIYTVHGAKGLENPHVLVLEDWFVSAQTENMRYVAYTRAEDELFLVSNFMEEKDFSPLDELSV